MLRVVVGVEMLDLGVPAKDRALEQIRSVRRVGCSADDSFHVPDARGDGLGGSHHLLIRRWVTPSGMAGGVHPVKVGGLGVHLGLGGVPHHDMAQKHQPAAGLEERQPLAR